MNRFIGKAQIGSDYRTVLILAPFKKFDDYNIPESFDFTTSLVVDLDSASVEMSEKLTTLSESSEAEFFPNMLEFLHTKSINNTENITSYLHRLNMIIAVPASSLFIESAGKRYDFSYINKIAKEEMFPTVKETDVEEYHRQTARKHLEELNKIAVSEPKPVLKEEVARPEIKETVRADDIESSSEDGILRPCDIFSKSSEYQTVADSPVEPQKYDSIPHAIDSLEQESNDIKKALARANEILGMDMGQITGLLTSANESRNEDVKAHAAEILSTYYPGLSGEDVIRRVEYKKTGRKPKPKE